MATRSIDSHRGFSTLDAPASSRCHLAVHQLIVNRLCLNGIIVVIVVVVVVIVVIVVIVVVAVA